MIIITRRLRISGDADADCKEMGVRVCRAEAGTWEEVQRGVNKPGDRAINIVCDRSFWNWHQNRFLGCRACRRYDTGREGRRSATGQVTSLPRRIDQAVR